MEKVVRCTLCYAEFTDEEIRNTKCCPSCGTKGLPMLIKHDVKIEINWHELRILTMWAERWADSIKSTPGGEGADELIKKIAARLSKFRPKGAAALTMDEEFRELQERFPSAAMYDSSGKPIKPPLDEGKA